MRQHEQILLHRPDIQTLFWDRVEKSLGCWLWTGLQNVTGYGEFYFLGSYLLAHRAMFIIANKQAPAKLCVLHNCDVRNCVNPQHLRLGTQKDNIQDMYKKGRAAKSRAKLSEDQVRQIRLRRKNGERGIALAIEYGITPHQVAAINTGRDWKGLS